MAGVVLALTVMTLRSEASSVPTVSAANGWAGVTQHKPYGVLYTFGAIDPCMSHGSITVVGLRFAKSSGLALDGWGSRPNPFITHSNQTGDTNLTLAQAGFSTGPATTDAQCSVNDNPTGREFAIEVRRTDPHATGWVDGLTASFVVKGSHTVHHSLWTLAYALCDDSDTTPLPRHLGELCSPPPGQAPRR